MPADAPRQSECPMMNTTPDLLRQLSSKDFAAFGVNDIAYVKHVSIEDVQGFAIHAADGTQLAVLPERDVAFAAVRQHDMEPFSVH
jgi:hypothetical protein